MKTLLLNGPKKREAYNTGYCIGFWEEKLRNTGFFTSGGPVIYQNERDLPLIDPLKPDIKDTFKASHFKSSDWSYEKEYRLIKFYYPHSPTPEERVVVVPDSFIAEVYIGLNASKETKDEILIATTNRNIKVFQMEKEIGKFKLKANRIK